MVGPDDLFAKIGDVETYFTHAIHVRESVPPVVNFFYGCVPVVIEVGLKALGLQVWGLGIIQVLSVCFIIVPAYVTACHYPISRNLFIAISPAIFSASA